MIPAVQAAVEQDTPRSRMCLRNVRAPGFPAVTDHSESLERPFPWMIRKARLQRASLQKTPAHPLKLFDQNGAARGQVTMPAQLHDRTSCARRGHGREGGQ